MMIPTLLGVTVIVFVIINLAPGSPIEQKLRAMRFGSSLSSGAQSGDATGANREGAVSQEVIDALKSNMVLINR